MCVSGIVFDGPLQHPTDDDGNILPLKAPPTAVRSSTSVAWSAIIQGIDAYFAAKSMRKCKFCVK